LTKSDNIMCYEIYEHFALTASIVHESQASCTNQRLTLPALTVSTITPIEMKEAFENPMADASKAVIKRMNTDAEKAMMTHGLRINHSEILQGFSHTKAHPLWKRPSTEVSTFVKWLIGATDLIEDRRKRGYDASQHCRLCGTVQDETREHLLLECNETTAEKFQFFEKVSDISKLKSLELTELDPKRQWHWILAGGTVREDNPYPVTDNRIHANRSPLSAGKSVTPVEDKKDPMQCLIAYNEYREILEELEESHIRVYTDGSHNKQDKKTGCGFMIVNRSGRDEKTYHKEYKGLGSTSVNQAELTAVHEAISTLLRQRKKNIPIHIFTDSKYTYNVCTTAETRRKHFYLAQEIHNLSHRLRECGCQVTMHWLPSHIENTASGRLYTGNYYADKLADQGREISTEADKETFLHIVREKIISATIQYVNSIDKKIELLNETPNGPPANVDDLSACAHANRDPFAQGIS